MIRADAMNALCRFFFLLVSFFFPYSLTAVKLLFKLVSSNSHRITILSFFLIRREDASINGKLCHKYVVVRVS